MKREFNKRSRTGNAVLSATVGISADLISKLVGFVYRTVFISILSAEYLGLNGLFSNILELLSLTELGISSAIVFRLYKPISENNAEKVGQIMNFFKVVYRIIGGVIFVLGMAILPFISFFISDGSQVPEDVNLYVIYFLFLLNTVSSYTYSYKQTLLSADQRGYLKSLGTAFATIGKYIVQIIVLYLSKNYTLCLLSGVMITILTNIIISIWVSSLYPDVFRTKESISKTERSEILQDTKATMIHNVGGKVLGATDSIVLSKYVGLAAAGLYSNYSLVLSVITSMIYQLFGSFVSSIGNSNIENSNERNYEIFNELLFMNFWIAGLFTAGLLTNLNDFITIWIGNSYALSFGTCVTLCVQFFLEEIRIIPTGYTNATGLFVRDRYRPLIEAAINLIVSIYMAKKYGIVGVFLGTIISHLATVSWREPYLLYKNIFRKSIIDYWKKFFLFAFLTVAVGAAGILAKRFLNFEGNTILKWGVEGMGIVSIYVAVSTLLFGRSQEMKSMLQKFKKLVSKLYVEIGR